MRTGGAVARRGAVLVALALTGCGASHPGLQHLPRRVSPVSSAPQLVSMRRINGATWQTVIIRTDGTGDVGIFIGEMAGSGTKHHEFRVPPSQLARLRLLIAHADQVRRTPAFSTVQPAIEYIVITARNDFELAQGQVPPRLEALVGALNGYIDRHA